MPNCNNGRPLYHSFSRSGRSGKQNAFQRTNPHAGNFFMMDQEIKRLHQFFFRPLLASDIVKGKRLRLACSVRFFRQSPDPSPRLDDKKEDCGHDREKDDRHYIDANVRQKQKQCRRYTNQNFFEIFRHWTTPPAAAECAGSITNFA